jgi:hypothetical protein
MGDYYVSLGASSAMKDEKVKEKYAGLAGMMEGADDGFVTLDAVRGKFSEMRLVAIWLVDLIDVMSEGGYAGLLVMREKAPNEFAAEMASVMAEYLEKVTAFSNKYAEAHADNYGVMTEEYGVILAEGEALERKYEKMTLVDVVGVSEQDVRGWFEELRQLRVILEEKK